MTFPEVRHAKSMLIDATQNLREVTKFSGKGTIAYEEANFHVNYWSSELEKRLDLYEKETGSRPF